MNRINNYKEIKKRFKLRVTPFWQIEERMTPFHLVAIQDLLKKKNQKKL